MLERLATLSTNNGLGSSGGADPAAAARIVARSIYRELRAAGYSPLQVLALSTELIDLVTRDLETSRERAS